MKADEFVKKYSIDKAKELVSSVINTISVDGYACDPCFITDDGEHISYNELKHLVESHEYIENFGGLDKANRLRGLACFLTVKDFKEHNKHIENVESCL